MSLSLEFTDREVYLLHSWHDIVEHSDYAFLADDPDYVSEDDLDDFSFFCQCIVALLHHPDYQKILRYLVSDYSYDPNMENAFAWAEEYVENHDATYDESMLVMQNFYQYCSWYALELIDKID